MNKALRSTLRIVVPYLLFGVAWIFFSDDLLGVLVGPNVDDLRRYQTLKGWFFIAVTTLLLSALCYWLLAQLFRLRELDEETGLPHRALFLQYLSDTLARERRPRDLLLVVFAIDGFSDIANRRGREGTDRLLAGIGSELLTSFTADVMLSRLGSDDFALAIPLDRTGDAERPLDVAMEARRRLLAPLTAAGEEATACGGAALYPRDADDGAALLAAATRALQAARRRGNNQLRFFSDRLTSSDRERDELARHLRRALDRQELHVVYQPQVDTRSMRLTGVEALARWRREDGRDIPPARFVPVAARHDLGRALTAFVLRRAAADLDAAGLCDGALPRLGINLLAEEFGRIDFVDWLLDAARPFAHAALTLQLEITEHTALADVARARARIEALRERGITVAVDDFGTGYSSLAVLKDLPVEELKIDQSFVAGLGKHDSAGALVAAIVGLAEGFAQRTVAEGIETAEQLRHVRDAGCDEVQGFHLARPMSARELAGCLRDGNRLTPAAPGLAGAGA